jgi:hypothetical protein
VQQGFLSYSFLLCKRDILTIWYLKKDNSNGKISGKFFVWRIYIDGHHKIIISQNGKRLSSFKIWLIEQSVGGLPGGGRGEK